MDYLKSVYSTPKGTNRRTSYSLMNQWTNYTRPPRPAADLAVDDQLASVYTALDFPPTTEQPKELSSREQRLLGSRNGRDPLVAPLGQKRGTLSPINLDRSLYYRGDRNRNSRAKTSMSADTSRGRVADPYGNADAEPVHLKYGKTGAAGYDDSHRSFLSFQQMGLTPTYPMYGPPRLRNGKMGGSWRHVKEVLQAKGMRTVFVDGSARLEDSMKLTNSEVPQGNLIQGSVRKDTIPFNEEFKGKHTAQTPLKMTAYDKAGLKSAEGSNYMVMR